MSKDTFNPLQSTRPPDNTCAHLRIPVADTILDCNDSRGSGHPVIFLNGAFSSQRDWKKVLSRLGSDYRTITYDERARGKSEKSSDYSFEGCLDDLAAVIAATGIKRPLLVGWSLELLSLFGTLLITLAISPDYCSLMVHIQSPCSPRLRKKKCGVPFKR